MTARDDYQNLDSIATGHGVRQLEDAEEEAILALDELDDLRRWRSEALDLLNQWFGVADVVESAYPCPLGHSRVENALRFVLKATVPTVGTSSDGPPTT